MNGWKKMKAEAGEKDVKTPLVVQSYLIHAINGVVNCREAREAA